MTNDSSNKPKKKDIAIPRLNIAVYTLSNHLADVAGQLIADRRFVNSKISIFGGGVQSAISYYKENLTPDMLIIEFDSDLNSMMHELMMLSEVCDVKTRVIIAGQTNDVSLYRELIRNGIAEYLVLPTTPTGLISSISSIYHDQEATPLAPSVVFVGTGGGVGTSIIAQSMALNLANNYNTDTIFVDFDTAFPLTTLSWSVEESHKNINSLLQSGQHYVDDPLLRSCLLKVSDNLTALVASSEPLVDWDSTYEGLLLDTIKASRRLSDYTVLDIPSGRINVEKRAALLSATNIVIVTEPTFKGIRNLGILYFAIKKIRPNDVPPLVVINKFDEDNPQHLTPSIIEENTGIAASVIFPFLEKTIDEAIAGGVPVSSLNNSDEFNTAIEQLTCLLIGKEFVEEEEDSKLGNLFKNLKKTIGL